jgi:hypothetical protein
MRCVTDDIYEIPHSEETVERSFRRKRSVDPRRDEECPIIMSLE